MLIWMLPMDKMIITQTFTMARWQIVVKKSEATNKPKTKTTTKQKYKVYCWRDCQFSGLTLSRLNEKSMFLKELLLYLYHIISIYALQAFLAVCFCQLNHILVYVMLNVILFKNAVFYWPGFFSSVITLCYIYFLFPMFFQVFEGV